MIVLRVEPGVEAARALAAIKAVAWEHPGEHRLALQLGRMPGARQLTLGEEWRYADSEECLCVLAEFGLVELVG